MPNSAHTGLLVDVCCVLWQRLHGLIHTPHPSHLLLVFASFLHLRYSCTLFPHTCAGLFRHIVVTSALHLRHPATCTHTCYSCFVRPLENSRATCACVEFIIVPAAAPSHPCTAQTRTFNNMCETTPGCSWCCDPWAGRFPVRAHRLPPTPFTPRWAGISIRQDLFWPLTRGWRENRRHVCGDMAWQKAFQPLRGGSGRSLHTTGPFEHTAAHRGGRGC